MRGERGREEIEEREKKRAERGKRKIPHLQPMRTWEVYCCPNLLIEQLDRIHREPFQGIFCLSEERRRIRRREKIPWGASILDCIKSKNVLYG